MSVNGNEVESMEGWSIVRHKPKDELGSDADSVEVISEDSDRETSSEDGKDGFEDSVKPVSSEGANSTTPNPDVDSDGGASDESDDLNADVVGWDPLGDLISCLSDKLHHLLCAGRQHSLSREDLILRYIIIASALLALTCSLFVSSYLLFFKLNYASDDAHDRPSSHVLHELDQVVSKLQNVLRLENEEHLREILSKMPAHYLNLERLIPMADHLPRQSADDLSLPNVQGLTGVTANAPSDAKIVHELEQNRHNSIVNAENVGNAQVSKQSEVNTPQAPTTHDSYKKNLLKPIITQFAQNMGVDRLKKGSSDSASVKPTFAKTVNSSDATDRTPTQNKTELPHPLPIKNMLFSVRQDVISIQKDIYNQIMNSLLEYKIELYKNLLRAGLDVSCPENSNKKANHKHFMLMRSLQQIIAKSSESNFESWYKFYSYSVFPKIRQVVSKLDSISQAGSNGPKLDLGKGDPKDGNESIKVDDLRMKHLNDDFFVRAADPHVESASKVEALAGGGFDWKNLDKKIRESMKHALKHISKNSGSEGERAYGEKYTMNKNYVEIGKDKAYQTGKDRHNKNNLKGDFRKRRNGTQDQKRDEKEIKHRLQKEFEHKQKSYKLEKQQHAEERRQVGKNGKSGDHEFKNRKVDGNNKKNHKREDDERRHQELGKEGHEYDEFIESKRKQKDYIKEYEEHEDKYRKYYEAESSSSEEPRQAHKSKAEDDERKVPVDHDSYDAPHSNKVKHREYRNVKQTESGSRTKYGDEDNEKDYKKTQAKREHKKSSEKYDKKRESQDHYSRQKDRKNRRKSFLNNVGKYVKTTASRLWNTVEGGYKNVKNYGKKYLENWHSRKSDELGKYEEWREEFVREMKDVVRVLGGNPTLVSLSHVPKSVSKFLGDGLRSVIGSFEEEGQDGSERGPEGMSPGPEGVKEEEMCYADNSCSDDTTVDDDDDDRQWSSESIDEGYRTSEGHTSPESLYSDARNHRGTDSKPDGGLWYSDFSKHRAEARQNPHYPRASDSSWFLGLGRHRSYLRRRGIHLDDDGSWFISSAKHRAKMRQKHLDPADAHHFYSQASSKR